MIENKFNNKGITLLEIVAGIGIFTIVLLSSTMIFQKVIAGQSLAIASQNTQEAMRYVMEVVSKEIRMAKKDFSGSCVGAGYAGAVYRVWNSNQNLRFINEYGECVTYRNNNNRLQINRAVSGYFTITPDEVLVSNLRFYETGGAQEQITIAMTIYTNNYTAETQMDLQTTISNRYYLEDAIIP